MKRRGWPLGALALARALVAAALLLPACSGGPDGPATPARQGGTVAPPAGAGPVTATGPVTLGVKWDWDRFESYRPFLEGFPGGDTWYELVWCDTEAERGSYDWSRPDRAVDGAGSVGFRIALKIRTGSCWATGERLEERGRLAKTASLPPADPADYEAFVTAVVERYAPRGVHRYALENEVNGAGFWAGTPEEYEQLARAGSAAVRAADPEAVVFDSGLSATTYGAAVADALVRAGRGDEALAAWQAAYERRFARRADDFPPVGSLADLRRALEGEQPARNLAFLAASLRLARDGVVDAWQFHDYEPWHNAGRFTSFLRANLPEGMPVEVWETGLFWPGGGDDLEGLASEQARLVATLLAGGARNVTWLPAAHNPDSRRGAEVRWGLFNADGSPRPLGRLFRTLAVAAAGATARPLARADLGGVLLDRAGQATLVVWSDCDGGARLSGPGPAGATVARADGGAAPSWDDAGLEVGAAPLLIDLPAADAARLAGRGGREEEAPACLGPS